MTSAYEWIITTRSFHRTRIELSSAALSLTLTAEQNIWIIQIVRKIDLKKKYTFPDFNNIPAKAEILKIPSEISFDFRTERVVWLKSEKLLLSGLFC